MDILAKIHPYILMLMSLCGFLSGEMIKCDYNRKNAESEDSAYRYTFCVCIIGVLFILGISGFSINISFFTAVSAILFGVLVVGQIAASAYAMKIGPWAYTAVMMSLSTVIPALSGAILWNEKLDSNKIIGIILMLICFVLSVKTDENDTEKKKSNIKWFLFSLIASLSTGGIGILQKFHQSSAYKSELVGFMVISFTFSAVLSVIMINLMGRKSKFKSDFELKPKSKVIINKSVLPLFIIAGIGTALNHFINLYLSGAMESAVFFPIMSGGELIFVTVASVLIFKERLSLRQWLGLVCGILAVVIFSV